MKTAQSLRALISATDSRMRWLLVSGSGPLSRKYRKAWRLRHSQQKRWASRVVAEYGTPSYGVE